MIHLPRVHNIANNRKAPRCLNIGSYKHKKYKQILQIENTYILQAAIANNMDNPVFNKLNRARSTNE